MMFLLFSFGSFLPSTDKGMNFQDIIHVASEKFHIFALAIH